MDPLKIYDYLTQARERVFAAVRPLSPEQYRREFDFGLHTLARTLTHIMISEWYYIERLAGRTLRPYDEWPIRDEIPPAFEVLESTWREQARHTRAALAAERDWRRVIQYLGFPDDHGKRYHVTATAGDLAAQLALHEVHHRAQLMAMLRRLGDERPGPPLQDLDYNDLMFERRAATDT